MSGNMMDVVHQLTMLQLGARITREDWYTVLEQIPFLVIDNYDHENPEVILAGWFPESMGEHEAFASVSADLHGVFSFCADGQASAMIIREEGEEMIAEGDWTSVLIALLDHLTETLSYPDPQVVISKMANAYRSRYSRHFE